VDENNDELPIYLISGGEDVRLNFALRIALTRLITQRTGAPMQYLVLDEAFEFQDFEHSERMVETLQTLQSIYPQIFLISHGSDLDELGVVDYEIRVGRDLTSERVTVEPV
jgi:exonuclease SbcC